jgi:hypothetical protein
MSEQPKFTVKFKKTDPDAKLPELELKLVATSKDKIGDPGQVEMVKPWGDYTLCSRNDKSVISIYNDKLEKIESVIQKNYSGNFMKIATRHLGSLDSSNYIDPREYKKLPEVLQIPIKKHKPEAGISSAWIGDNYTHNILNVNRDSMILENGRYVIFVDRGNLTFQAFVTENEQGITLAPQNWKGYGSEGVHNIPTELEKKVVEILKQKDEIKDLNDTYTSVLTDVGINILSRDESNTRAIFSENLPSIRDNIAVDPTNKNIVYFCQEGTPNDIVRLDMSADPSIWKSEYAPLPQEYKQIKNLQLDPTGTFFLFYSDKDLVMITKDTLEEVKRMPNVSNVNFDSQGRIRGVDPEGHLVLYAVDYDSLSTALARRKAQALTTGIDITNIFDKKAQEAKTYDETTVENLKPVKEEWESKILPKITAAADIGEALSLRANLATLRSQLRAQNLGAEQIQFVTEGIEKAILAKEKEYASKEAQKSIQEIEDKLNLPVSLSTIGELRSALGKLKPIEGALDMAEREKVRKLAEEVNKRAVELFGREASRVIEELNKTMEGTKKQLEGLSNKNEFDFWMEFRFPQLKLHFGALLEDCPIEAFEASEAITNARNSLVATAETYKKKFELEYAKVREGAVERTNTVVKTLEDDVASIADRLKTRQFETREEAEQYLTTSESKRVLEEEIKVLAKSDKDAAKELERGLKVSIANALASIERGGSKAIAETGQQMVLFGKTAFPRFEGKVKEKHETQVDVVFAIDDQSKGPGIKPEDFYGDVKLVVTNPKGEKRIVRLYEDMENEDEWRLGLLAYRGDAVPPSYVKAGDFKQIKKDLNSWQSGELKKEDEKLRTEISDLFKQREKPGKRDATKDLEWQKSYQEKIDQYSKFCTEKHILFFKRMDKVKDLNSIDANGKGFVPKWQNHWVLDDTTEAYLEKMAGHFKMQGELQEGVLNLLGHAGTGKDVLIKMFASQEKSNRPYFSVDCTKWTTEYELAEDVVLEAKDGATQTVRVPSAVLTGIQTPGAIVYFNEFNAMPEQAQIFLHALFDEKRTMTLKTSSGKSVRAHSSVLFACSMNPNYRGTNEPQFATKSRMVPMEIEYPALRRVARKDEPSGREAPYNASEALRIARGVESLMDFTYEQNMQKNELVQIWDKHINGIQNEAPDISKIQLFDLTVIRSLIQFADKLREEFKRNFEKVDTKGVLPVSQPLTLREMRRCAYALSKMPDTDKLTKDADTVARDFIREYFLSNIYETANREKIDNALKSIHPKNRVL